MNKIIFSPSVYAHVINGVLILFAFIVLCKNYSKIGILEPYKFIMLLLVFSMAVGIHGLSHLGLEKIYGYNLLNFIYK